MTYHFLFLVGWLAACTSPASRSPTLIHLTSTTSLQAQSNGSAVEGDVWTGYCTKFERWSVPKLDPRDCGDVLDWFYIHTMHEGGRKKEEFVAPGAKQASFEGTLWTPRKYTFGTCTLAVVMVEDFPNRASLPGGPKSGPLSDFSTYANIYQIAEDLVRECVQRRGEVGWQPTGLNDGIGVFIWSTGSEEDKEIEADEPRFFLPIDRKTTPRRNGSTANV